MKSQQITASLTNDFSYSLFSVRLKRTNWSANGRKKYETRASRSAEIFVEERKRKKKTPNGQGVLPNACIFQRFRRLCWRFCRFDIGRYSEIQEIWEKEVMEFDWIVPERERGGKGEGNSRIEELK